VILTAIRGTGNVVLTHNKLLLESYISIKISTFQQERSCDRNALVLPPMLHRLDLSITQDFSIMVKKERKILQ
jgi:hypothetical protein